MSWIDTWIWKYNLGSIFDPSGFLVLIQVVDEEPRAIAEVHIVPAIDGPANNLQAQIIQYSLEPHSLARKGSVHIFLIQILECNWVKSSSLWTAKKRCSNLDLEVSSQQAHKKAENALRK